MQPHSGGQDYYRNSEFHALQTILPEISRLANNYAVLKAQNERENFIDHYMMYYRIEFTRQLDLKHKDDTHLYIFSTETVIESDIFNDTLGFCFHEKLYDPVCEACIKKLNISTKSQITK